MIPDTEKWPTQAEMLVNRVKKNNRRLKTWLERQQVSCFRMYNWDIPEIPLLIDNYEGRLHVGVKIRNITDEASENRWVQYLADTLSRELGVPSDDVFIKFRRQGKGGTQYAPFSDARRIYHVGEGGHRFIVNLSDYLDTGLFLDHRQTRKMIEQEAAGKRFLNLFAYTGSFSVYAAAGGAVATTTVDLSNTYLNAAKANMELNGFIGGSHRYKKHDILDLLREGDIREMYDLVVMDAPTTSISKAMKQNLAIQKDYAWMLNALLKSVSKDGVVYFSCNLSNFRFDAGMVSASSVQDITAQTIPPDFSMKPPHKCFRLVK